MKYKGVEKNHLYYRTMYVISKGAMFITMIHSVESAINMHRVINTPLHESFSLYVFTDMDGARELKFNLG
jgi:hypothetical protein